ncbi:MAG: universal stress protein UspA [Desulfobacterales bacterium]|nr:MAG: universal stress protein UspA [Desulfobacterales bacterium]
MQSQIFHIFRNTPLGRETFSQTLHFCRQSGLSPVVYIPRFVKFLMYFEDDVVQVDLDASYLTDPDTALPHAEQLMADAGVAGGFLEPRNFTASTLPDIPTQFDFMTCPRSISDLSSKIGMGYVGPRVRRIVNAARFPVLLTTPVFKPWDRITVMFGGSTNAVSALRLGLRISRLTGLPLSIFTLLETSPDKYRNIIEKEGLSEIVGTRIQEWEFCENRHMEAALYDISPDALIVAGAFGHGLIRDLMFGSVLERMQTVLCNNILIVGPKYAAPMSS